MALTGIRQMEMLELPMPAIKEATDVLIKILNFNRYINFETDIPAHVVNSAS